MKSVGLFAGTLLIALFAGCGSARPSADDFRKEISSQLPIGSNKAEVSKFLDSRNISHSDIQDHNEYDEKHNWITVRIMTASIRSKGILWDSQVYMVFYFDESDRLVKYQVRNVRTGL